MIDNTCLIDGVEYDRLYDEGPDWFATPNASPEAERAYREAYRAGAEEACQWDFPDVDAVAAAEEARNAVRRQAETLVTSAQLFNNPSFDDYEVKGTHFVYRKGYDVAAATARGRHHALDVAKQDWWDLADLGLDDDEDIRRLFMRPWSAAVAAWCQGSLERSTWPPCPLGRFTPEQWECVLDNQTLTPFEYVTDSVAEDILRQRYGAWNYPHDCLDPAGTLLGRFFRWQRRGGDLVRLLVRRGECWVLYDARPGETKMQAVGTSELILTGLAGVERELLEWLWPGRIPLGKLTLVAGDPGLGKSFVTLDIASRVSRGAPWPDLPLLKQVPGIVVLFSAEDDLGDTIAPRLDRMGANDRFIHAVQGVKLLNKQRHFSLETDLRPLEAALDNLPGTRLVVIDPIAAYCGKVDSHKNTDVRGLLAPLAELAARRRIAVVAVTHLSKTGGNKAVYRAMGSLAFAAAARAVWAITKDTNDPQRRLFLPAKLNLARDPDGLAYRITDGRVEWDSEPVKMHADEAFAAEARAAEGKGDGRGGERREAMDWLREQLANGPVSSKQLGEDAKEMGFSDITLRRAYKEMGGKARKSQFAGGWVWELPGEGDHEDDQFGPVTLK